MFNRSFKRIIVLFVVFLLLGSGVFLYWQSKSRIAPTCFDNIQNQNETGVDCGGVCASCQGKPENLQMDPAIFIPAENNRFDIAFRLVNPNTNYGASRIDYNIKIISSDGLEISSRADSTFILPAGSDSSDASKKWVVEHGFKSESGANIEVTLTNIIWELTKENLVLPRLIILNRAYNLLDNSPEYAEAKGILKNDSPYNFDLIEIQVLLFGEDDKLVAVRKTEARTMRTGERREFRVSWRTPMEKVSRVEMVAYTNVFLNENLVNDYGIKEKFQELNPVIR